MIGYLLNLNFDSFTIDKIIRKAAGDSNTREEKNEEEKRSLSPYSRAFQMFKDKLSLAYVAIELDIKTDIVLNFHSDYLRRKNGWSCKNIQRTHERLSTVLSSV